MILLFLLALFNYRDAAEKVGTDFYKQIGYNLVGIGYGVMNEVNRYQFMFETSQQFNKDTARTLIISSVEDLKNRINQTRSIRPYLEHYPYTEKGINLTFLYNDGSVAAIKGKIYFTHPDKTEEVETYEEAKAIVSKRLPAPSA